MYAVFAVSGLSRLLASTEKCSGCFPSFAWIVDIWFKLKKKKKKNQLPSILFDQMSKRSNIHDPKTCMTETEGPRNTEIAHTPNAGLHS